MMRSMPPLPLTREVVLIGGGHAHALVLRRWGMRPLPGARLTVINPAPTAPYTGMLPGHIAGHYPLEALQIDLVRLARHAGARLILGRADQIDRAHRQVHIAGRGWIAYDVVSLDIGVTSEMPELPGFAENAVPAKPLDRMAAAWDRFAAEPPERPRLAVIGGGIAGVELAMAMAWRLRKNRPAITVVDAGAALTEVSPAAGRILRERLRRLDIGLIEHARVEAVGRRAVQLAGREVPTDFTVGAAGARPHRWLAKTRLALTDGYVTVDRSLRAVDEPGVFAVGDCAHLRDSPRPKAGVFAVRQAPVLFVNLRAELTGRRLRRYRPQTDFLKLISLGRRSALAEKWGLALAAPVLWRWKDRIDRRFMDRLSDLPPMPRPDLPREATRDMAEALGSKPMCGGCGAKVGGDALVRALAGLPLPPRSDVASPLGDDAATLLVGGVRQVLTTDHLRAFTEDPWVMARIAATHAMGDIWAMGASPQAALATVVLPRMTPRLQESWLAEIMAAAAETFGAEGAAIVGGHSSLGAELTVGFTVTGLCETRAITLTGALPGDALVLTKPIGSGTILAGEMALEARGPCVASCLELMQQSQGAAMRLLGGATAMTDVTGFGLAGHLANMLRASGCAAALDLDAVPLMEGALDLARRGTRSTLFDANVRAAGSVSRPHGPRGDLLFDPQTAGGLLAALPAATADETVAALRDAGYGAARIGRAVTGRPAITAT